VLELPLFWDMVSTLWVPFRDREEWLSALAASSQLTLVLMIWGGVSPLFHFTAHSQFAVLATAPRSLVGNIRIPENFGIGSPRKNFRATSPNAAPHEIANVIRKYDVIGRRLIRTAVMVSSYGLLSSPVHAFRKARFPGLFRREREEACAPGSGFARGKS
jgi:hypothetical protein